MESVLLKIANRQVTQQELANYYGIGSTGMITQAQMLSGFRAYGLTQMKGAGASNEQRMFYSLVVGYPSVGFFMPSVGTAGHFAVIRTIDYENSVFSFMNPYSGAYEIGTISSSKSYSFYSVPAGKTYNLSGFLYYES